MDHQRALHALRHAMPILDDPHVFRQILDNLQIGVSVIDAHKKIIFWSDGAERITGYARIDVLGHSCVENILLHCNFKSCEMCVEKCPISAALHDGKPLEANGFVHHRAGHRAPVHLWAIPLRDQSGAVIGVIQTFEAEYAVTGPDPNDESMRAQGCLDELTKLPNQAMMQAHLREALGTFAQLHIPFGIVFLEAHELPKFRARYGQEAGSSMLQVLGRTLRNTVWSTDFVGRWSEQQFLVILAGCTEKQLHDPVGRIVRMMASASIKWWGQELSMAVSTGLAAATAGDDAVSLLLRAQQDMSQRHELAFSGATAPPAGKAQSGGAS